MSLAELAIPEGASSASLGAIAAFAGTLALTFAIPLLLSAAYGYQYTRADYADNRVTPSQRHRRYFPKIVSKCLCYALDEQDGVLSRNRINGVQAAER